MKKNLYLLLMFLAAFFAACDDTDKIFDTTEVPPSQTNKLMILCEGSFDHNNSTLAYYDLSTKKIDLDYFKTVNGRGLGDTANDILKYGSKIYVVVNVSGSVEVLDAKSGRSIESIDMKTTSLESKQPRYAAAYGGKVYVTSFDDTVTRIDTVTLAIDGSVKVGRDPEGICIKNNKIYVANSGGLDYATGNYDTTVSIINLQNFTVEKTVEVGTNPYQVFADSEGDVYVTTRGNYADIAPAFKKIDTNYKVTTINNVQVSEFTIVNDKAYILYNEWGNPSTIKVFDCNTEKVTAENFVTDGTSIPNGYKISADAYSGEVYVTTSDYSNFGNVFCFDKDGKFKFKLSGVGLGPNKVIFLN